MAVMSATDVKNRIGELWDLADREPVTVERNGVAAYQVIRVGEYIAITIDEYERLTSTGHTPHHGFAKDAGSQIDANALLAVDISDLFQDYTS